MKKILRSISGLLSSLLLVAGLTHAAEHLDPVTQRQADASRVAAKSGPLSDGPVYACEHAGSRVAAKSGPLSDGPVYACEYAGSRVAK